MTRASARDLLPHDSCLRVDAAAICGTTIRYGADLLTVESVRLPS